ncbi:hypothetical protein GIB67_010303, partial [Kingdonia uniflora]
MSEGTLRKDKKRGQQNKLINEESCYDRNVVLSKRYKVSDMESGKDASILESRMVRTRGNKCQPHKRKKINSSSSSPNNRFTTKDLESTQRERRKIRGINQKFSEDDKRLKRAKGSGSHRWERGNKVRRITPVDILQFYGVMNFKASGESYFYASVTRHHFFDLNSAGRTWNDNIIWVKGNCLQRDDEELLDLRFRSVKQSVKSTVERKESLLDEVAEEEIELELVLGELGLSRKKKFESRLKKIAKAQSTRSMTGVDEGTRQTSGDEVARLIKGIWLSIEEQESELKKAKNELEKNLARAKTDTLKEVKQLKAAHAMAIEQLQVKAKTNLDETTEKHDRLGHHLMLKGYSQEEADVIKADTFAEEEEEEAEVLGVVDGLDGVSPQIVLDNQGDDAELPVDGSEKVVKEMSLRINDLESGLAREIETSKALLSAQAELQ